MDVFEFQHITSDKIEKIIDKINIKKASGFDNIPAKVILIAYHMPYC
jgi:hypothetical protein